MWSYQPKDAAAVVEAAAAAAAEAAEAAARQAFLQDWTAAVAAAAAQRPASVAEQQQQWLSGPHKDRVQALLVGSVLLMFEERFSTNSSWCGVATSCCWPFMIVLHRLRIAVAEHGWACRQRWLAPTCRCGSPL